MSNYYLFSAGSFLTRLFGRRVSYALAVILSDLHYFFSKQDRLAVESNLRVILNSTEVPAKTVRDVFRNFGKYLVDFFIMTRTLTPDFIRKNIDIKNLSCLNEVLKNGKGGIIVSGHLGNWEMGGGVLSLLGYPAAVIALPHKDPRVDSFFNRQREAFGCVVIPTNVAARRVMESLKNNKFVAILADRDFGQHGLILDFFGKKTMIPKGAAIFALKSGTPIIPLFLVRKDNDRFEVSLYPPIYPPNVPDGKITDEMIMDLTKRYVSIIEEEIKKNPSQWLMFREFGVA